MLQFSDAMPIYLFTLPTDMRKSFDGLSGLITSHFEGSLLTDGSLFVFLNRRRDRMKVMYFDRDGLAIWYKRLEAGRYELPESQQLRANSKNSMNQTQRYDVQLSASQLRLILDGIDLRSVRRRKRYTPSHDDRSNSLSKQLPATSGGHDDRRAIHRTTATARRDDRSASVDERGADRDGAQAAWRA